MNDKPTGKITTAACKQALADKWPEIFGVDLAKLAKDWKRVSKRGSAARGETVERLFFHGTLPLQALVKENQGAISEVIIRGFAPFDAGDGEDRVGGRSREDRIGRNRGDGGDQIDHVQGDPVGVSGGRCRGTYTDGEAP